MIGMRFRVKASVFMLVALVVFASGCSYVTPSQSQIPLESPRPKPPDVPRTGERVEEQALPPELDAWKAYLPAAAPGGVSAVVGDSLYILATPGSVNDDGQEFKISDVMVLDNRIEVEAYLVSTRSDSRNVQVYLKDYVRLPYKGERDLPVDLKIIYDSAAFAHIKGSFDTVEAGLLPLSLQDWGKAAEQPEDAKSAVVGAYLYVMVAASASMQEYHLGITKVEQRGNRVHVEVTYEPWLTGQIQFSLWKSPLFARIPYQGDSPFDVEVEYKPYVGP